MSQVRRLNENSNRRYQFYDRRIKNLLRKIHTDSREKPTKNNSDVSFSYQELVHIRHSCSFCYHTTSHHSEGYLHPLGRSCSPRTPLLSLSDANNERFVYLAAVPHSEDPDGGRGEQHHGVSAQHQLTSIRPAHPVSAPVPPQPGQWEGQDAKVCLFFLYKGQNIIGCILK